MIGKICGTGAYVPEDYLDNNDLAAMVETNDEWIQERTGIIRRHIIKDDTTVSMAVKASRRALDMSGLSPEDLDLIMLPTVSSNIVVPSAACQVQKELGAVNATCFDMNAACTGFMFCYIAAQAYISIGLYRNILVIGSESLSNLVNWKDRGTCILFGDGAGAAVIRAEEGTVYQPVTHSDGNLGHTLTCDSRHNKDWDQADNMDNTYLKMDGQAVFKFAVKKVPEVINEVLMKNQVDISDIDWFVLHQANKRIIDSIAKRLGVSRDKFPTNVEEYGNTSSASIPILLDEMNRKGLLKPGQKIMMAGFGGGLSWGAAIMIW